MRGSTDCSGQGLAEYLVIVVLVAIIVIFGIRYFGSSVTDQFQNATEQIENPDSIGRKPVSAKSSSIPENDPQSVRSHQHSTAEQMQQETPSDVDKTDSLSEQELRNQQIAKLSRGVGDQSGITEEVEINWTNILFYSAIVCAAGFLIVFFMLKKNKKSKSKSKARPVRASNKQGGQAMAEFVIVVITFLFVILGIIQLAMCLNAYALVRYAAYNAARAAIVHQADPAKMHEAARLSLVATFPKHGRADHRRGFMENYLAAVATDQNPALTYFNEPITQVKIVNMPANAVTFDDPLHSSQGIITVEVIHQYEMVIPLVNRIIFRVYEMWRGEIKERKTLDRLSAETNIMRRTGAYQDIEYRIPLVAHYTMRMQSDIAP